MSDPGDPFDEIVRHLDLDLTFPEKVEPPRPTPADEHPSRDREPADDLFYRQVPRREPRGMNPRLLLAWIGVIGGPACIMISGVLRLILPRPFLLGLGLIFVASAVYLIAQLPERGPAEPYWPDDGAQL